MSTNHGTAYVARAACYVLILSLLACGSKEQVGPIPIAWDREACSECRMLVGEPKFAAQLQTSEGEVLNFDDHGCLLRYVARTKPHVRAMYFHHIKEDRWLSQAQVGFVPASASPMGHGLGAVPQQTPGALTFQQATARVLEERSERGP